MQISPIQQVAGQTSSPVNMHVAAKIYSENSPASLSTDAAGFFAGAEVEVVHDLKKALMAAIDCGDFDKAIHILKCLKEIGFNKIG
jgi:excinuclease UvrABC nuclease subunit